MTEYVYLTEIDNKKILICNCEATMDIDDVALSKACHLKSKCNIHNNLCASELGVVLDQLKVGNKENKNLLTIKNLLIITESKFRKALKTRL